MRATLARSPSFPHFSSQQQNAEKMRKVLVSTSCVTRQVFVLPDHGTAALVQ